MGLFGKALGIAGAGLQLASGFQGAEAALENARAVEEAALFNSLLAEQEGATESARLRRRNRRLLSSQRVKFAKAGVRLEGTPMEVLAQNAAELELDAANVSIAARNTSELEQMRASNARRQGKRSARASILGGSARAAGTAFKVFQGP